MVIIALRKPYQSEFWALYFQRHYTKSPFVYAGHITSSNKELGLFKWNILLSVNNIKPNIPKSHGL